MLGVYEKDKDQRIEIKVMERIYIHIFRVQ